MMANLARVLIVVGLIGCMCSVWQLVVDWRAARRALDDGHDV